MTGHDGWLEQVRVEAGRCPSCGASAAQPIVHGMPRAEDYWRLRQLVVFAGCTAPEDLRRWACAACERWYGEPA